MAKAPETRDRFRIICETSEERMGTILAHLARMGVDSVDYELITDVRAFARNGPRPDVKGRDFASAWLPQHPTFAIKELVAHFKEAGRTPSGAYAAARELVEAGALRKLGEGQYQRADVKAITGPARTATKKAPRANMGQPSPRFEITGAEAIWRHLKGRQKFEVSELAALFREQGRKANSVSPIVNGMKKKKFIKMIEPGAYHVLKRPTHGRAAPKKIVTTPTTEPTENANA